MSLEVQGQPSPGPHAVGEAARRSRYCVACGAHHARPLFRDLVTCSACGMIYYPHRLAPEEVTRLYSEAYFGGAEYYDYLADRPVHEANFRARVRHLARWLPRGRHLLEVGCSYGFFLNLARARWRVRGCDIATEPCRYAREILGLDVLAGDFLEIPLARDEVDALCLWDTIEHLEDAEGYLARAADVLKPGGILALSTGDIGSWLARWQGPRWRQIHPPTHLWYFSRQTMRRTLDRFGFEMCWFRRIGLARSVGQIVYSLTSLKMRRALARPPVLHAERSGPAETLAQHFRPHDGRRPEARAYGHGPRGLPMMLLTRLTRARFDRSPAIVGGSPTSFPGGSSRPYLWGKLLLGLLPLALVLLLDADILRRRGVAGFVGSPDARFYVYQLHRMGELRGRWWELGSDALVGRPYPTAAAKHPGIYEGLDLLLPSAVTSRFLDPVANYLALLTLALACNGWVAALLAYRLTHSYRWSALAVVLITWNLSTGAHAGRSPAPAPFRLGPTRRLRLLPLPRHSNAAPGAAPGIGSGPGAAKLLLLRLFPGTRPRTPRAGRDHRRSAGPASRRVGYGGDLDLRPARRGPDLPRLDDRPPGGLG